jgi:hypothetical protein
MTHLLGPRIGEVCPKVDDETQGNEVTILGEGGGGVDQGRSNAQWKQRSDHQEEIDV